MNENTAKITIDLDASGRVQAVLEGTTENLLAMLTHCIGQVLQANHCCEAHCELEKLALAKDILTMEVQTNEKN